MGPFVIAWRFVKFVYEAVWLTTVVILGKFIPPIRRKHQSHTYEVMKITKFKSEDYEHTINSFTFIKSVLYSSYLDIFKEAKLNEKPIDCNVIVLGEEGSENTLANLLQLKKNGRPLVLNFGSCT